MSKEESLQARMQQLEGKRVLVVGLARSGRAAADLLHRRGAIVMVSDSRPPWSFAHEIPELLAAKIGIEFGQHGIETALAQDLIVVSPGVPWDLPALAAARERGIPVVAEVEAGAWFVHGDLVGVTGSNGKTTTTSLIGRMLESSGIRTMVGGNIGVPLTSMVDGTTDDSAVVVELSSFQLEGTESLHPRVAVILNITPNHLDRHPSLDAYVEAKARILRNQTADDYAVLNADDPVVMSLADRVHAQKVLFSRTQDLPEGLLISEGKVVYRVAHLERELFSPRDVRLRGLFNLENVLAASAAACVLGADFDVLGKAVREFRGVEHRLEPVGEVMGVEFYNDSKATSVDATVKALGAFDRGVHLILGGTDKGAPYAPIVPLLKGRVREVLLIGAAAGRIASELAGSVDLVQAGDLESATRQAFQNAHAGDVILLSPACASYDQFQDFEHRGRAFKSLVETLAREGETARASRSRAALQSMAPKPQRTAELQAGRPVQREQPAKPPEAAIHRAPAPASQPASVEPAATGVTGKAGSADEPLAEADSRPSVTGAAIEPVSATAAPIPEAAKEETSEQILLGPAIRESDTTGASSSTAGSRPEVAAEPAVVAREARSASEKPAAAPKRDVARLEKPVPDEARRPKPSAGERIYVYETDAEDRPPLDLPEVPLEDVELVHDAEHRGSPDFDSTELRASSGEPLIFEITSAAVGSPNSAPAERAGSRGRRKRSITEENTGPGTGGTQDRFPGV